MDANLVNVLSWTNPTKSAIILFLTNIALWFLLFQRPVTVMSLMLLIYYLRNLWIQRIRPEVLVDPPDSECWTNLSSYDFEHTLVSFGKNSFNFWITLRSENHGLWAIATCIICLIFANIGTFFSFNTALFLIANGAFLIEPLSKHFNLENVQTEEDELMIGTLDTSEGFWSPTPKETTPPPESLTPFQSMMPSHDNNDSEEEFLFDPNHFESNSSSSSSNSFELIHF